MRLGDTNKLIGNIRHRILLHHIVSSTNQLQIVNHDNRLSIVFFNIFNKNGEPKITNDLGGPDFTLLACVYPNLLIGIAEANMCSEEFVQKYQMRGDDNQVLVMMECRQR